MNETRALLSLAMSDDPVNWQLFHCYSLDDKLQALELFWSEVVDGLECKIIKIGYSGTDYDFETKLLFGMSARTELLKPYHNFYTKYNYLILEYDIIYCIWHPDDLKKFFINYVTKHHE